MEALYQFVHNAKRTEGVLTQWLIQRHTSPFIDISERRSRSVRCRRSNGRRREWGIRTKHVVVGSFQEVDVIPHGSVGSICLFETIANILQLTLCPPVTIFLLTFQCRRIRLQSKNQHNHDVITEKTESKRRERGYEVTVCKGSFYKIFISLFHDIFLFWIP